MQQIEIINYSAWIMKQINFSVFGKQTQICTYGFTILLDPLSSRLFPFVDLLYLQHSSRLALREWGISVNFCPPGLISPVKGCRPGYMTQTVFLIKLNFDQHFPVLSVVYHRAPSQWLRGSAVETDRPKQLSSNPVTPFRVFPVFLFFYLA